MLVQHVNCKESRELFFFKLHFLFGALISFCVSPDSTFINFSFTCCFSISHIALYISCKLFNHLSRWGAFLVHFCIEFLSHSLICAEYRQLSSLGSLVCGWNQVRNQDDAHGGTAHTCLFHGNQRWGGSRTSQIPLKVLLYIPRKFALEIFYNQTLLMLVFKCFIFLKKFYFCRDRQRAANPPERGSQPHTVLCLQSWVCYFLSWHFSSFPIIF